MNHNKEACQIKGCPYCDTTVNKIFAKIKITQKNEIIKALRIEVVE